MTSTPDRGRRRPAAAVALSLAAVFPAQPPPAEPPTPVAVARDLVDAFGPDAAVDTGCRYDHPTPIAYRTDRIILRPSPALSTPDAVARVVAALRAVMGPGTFAIGTPETITWDPAAAAASVASVAPVASAEEPLIWRVVSVPVRSLTGEAVPVLRVARRLPAEDLRVSLDYLLSPSSGPLGLWPDGEPEPTDGPKLPRPGIGFGTTAVVYDVGLPSPVVGNVPPNASRLSAADVEEPDRDGDGVADRYYAGHFLGISGILATLAPEATVEAVRITGPSGVATDFSAAKQMATTLRGAHDNGVPPELIVSAFGSSACETTPGEDMVPLGLQLVAEAVDRHRETVVVASAGNRGIDQLFYPAAFHLEHASVISVGSLDATSDGDGDAWTSASRSAARSPSSNYGSWVAAWAPGVKLETYHLIGIRFSVDGPEIDGWATAGGTSYAAPYTGGLILEEIARRGLAPLAAWEAVRAKGRVCSATSGGGVAVALSAMTATSTTPGDPKAPAGC